MYGWMQCIWQMVYADMHSRISAAVPEVAVGMSSLAKKNMTSFGQLTEVRSLDCAQTQIDPRRVVSDDASEIWI